MRIFVAGLIGGIVFFIWGALSHMVLHFGDMGFKYGTPYQGSLSALKKDLGNGGIAYLPSVPQDKMTDQAAVDALAAESAGQGYAFVVYAPEGNPAGTNMGPVLGKQFVTDVASALIAAFVLSLGAFGFRRRVWISVLLGTFAWLVVSVPYWNWYLFPLDYTVGLLAKFVVGWALAGAAIAWWLGRGEKTA
jgi:hypothetical protein